MGQHRPDEGIRIGTAGFRAARGAGPTRMNRQTVHRIAAGVARWLPPGASVAVGRDGRQDAAAFASELVDAMTAAGCHVEVLVEPVPTPVLAHRVRDAGLDAGLMCTASHNPPGDSGVKVYVAPGCQLDPADEPAVEAAIAGVPFGARGEPRPELVRSVDAVAVDGYLADVIDPLAAPVPAQPRLVHTALHGVGTHLVRAAFDRAGLPAPQVVPDQAWPDPTFPTTPYPNPEEPGALDLALAMARELDADAVLANDPDADRLAVAVPWPDGSWRVLTGDELGALLAEHLLAAGEGEDRLIVATHVSSRLVGKIAAAHGARYEETPTGFKWVMQAVLAHPGLRFVLGYEEALGYAVSDRVLDKDGVSAAVVAAQVVAGLQADGRTVADGLARLACRHGLHATRTLHVRLDPDAPPPTIDRLPEAWAERPDRRVVARRSGTEPKVKVYLECVSELTVGDAGATTAYLVGLDAAAAELDALEAEVRAWLGVG